MIRVEILDEKKPEHPYNACLMPVKWEFSLAKEVCYKETSRHYRHMLQILSEIKGLS